MSASDEMNAWNDSRLVWSGIPPHRIHVPRGLTNKRAPSSQTRSTTSFFFRIEQSDAFNSESDKCRFMVML